MSVSIRDVAKHAGVTIGTVSRAFNGYDDIRPETRDRVLASARALGYTPNVSARNLSAKKPPNLALIISGLLEGEPKDNLIYLLLLGVYSYAAENGLEVAVYTTDSKEQRNKSYTGFCKDHSISGAILSGVTMDDTYLTELLDSRIPCVAVDVPLKGKSVGWVSVDNVTAARQMAEHLIGSGHSKITVISGKKNAAVNLERMAGLYEAFREAKIPFTSNQVLYANFSESLAYNVVKEYLSHTKKEDLCSAFCCFSDIMACGAIAAVKDAGYRIPEDFSVTGFDGLAISEYISPPLTTITQDERQIGYEAAAMLHRLMSGGEGGHKVVPYIFSKRGSVRPL